MPKLNSESLITSRHADLMYWASSEHQIDFVTGSGDLVEVKAGPFSPKDFAWFRKSFPGAYPSVAIYNPWLCSESEHWD
jgi:hypothetical protein